MSVDYYISQVLSNAFGIDTKYFVTAALRFPRVPGTAVFPSPEIKVEQFFESRQSWMGTPILMPLSFIGGSNLKMLNEQGEVTFNRFGDFDLPASTLIEFSREKEMEATKVSGGSSTVKQIWGFSDWDIKIYGVCLDEPGVRTALQQKQALLMWERVVESFRVAGAAFDDTLVFNLLIKKINFKELEGQPGTIPFVMDCLSDIPDELDLDI